MRYGLCKNGEWIDNQIFLAMGSARPRFGSAGEIDINALAQALYFA